MQAYRQDSSVSNHPELKPISWSASLCSEAVTSSARPWGGTRSPKADLIGSFEPDEQLPPVTESINAPTSSTQQHHAPADEQHIAFCCHLYSLLGRAQMLCLEQIAEEEAAVEANPLQVANSTMSSSDSDVDARPDRQEQDDVQRALDLSMEVITQAGFEALPAQLYGSSSSSNGSVWSDLPATSCDKELQQALNNSLRAAGPVKPLVGPLVSRGDCRFG